MDPEMIFAREPVQPAGSQLATGRPVIAESRLKQTHQTRQNFLTKCQRKPPA